MTELRYVTSTTFCLIIIHIAISIQFYFYIITTQFITEMILFVFSYRAHINTVLFVCISNIVLYIFLLNHNVDNEVYAWGNNSMGQCGQGNSTGPITKPKKVVGLDGVAVQQISAGTSHSLAWTALPRDRSATIRVNTLTISEGNRIHRNLGVTENIHIRGRAGEGEC